MSQALIDAATTAGIGLTLLPTLYQTSDFGGAEPSARQRQFVLATDRYLDLVDGLSRVQSPQIEIGVALHSLRAVPPDAMRTVLTSLPAAKTIHIHIAEQDREVAAAQQHLHARPIEWLLEHAGVDRRWCLVHATHSTHAELKAVAATGAVVALCPTTEANLGDGIFALPTWLAAGGTFAIGSDSHISLSPAEELRWLEYEARLATKHRNVLAVQGNGSTGAMLWKHACAAGTHATARNIGAIEAGRRADIVVLDTNAPLFAGRDEERLIDTFVFSGTGHEVRDVMVAGRWLVQEGRHSAETAIAVNYKRAMNRILE
jgi:formimidoylglutamate deiminase